MKNYILDKDKVKKVLYGGDYNPEQWNEEVWAKDHELFKKAVIDIVTLNVFNWAMLQPDEETYNFVELDETVRRVTKHGMKICMATSTGAHPAWMARKYPDILRTDIQGRKRKFGKRHNSCPNSPTFQKYGLKLAEQVVMRYQKQENIVAWHISNEYSGSCYCDNCEKAFRVWLKNKYRTIEKLNRAWNTSFWSHTYYDWEDIVLPSFLSEMEDNDRGMFHGQILDYKRFNSDGMLKNYIEEYKVIKRFLPDAIITTNFMGVYKEIDYKKWAPYMDVISWDNYPATGEEPAYTALNHELMRGLKNGKPFMIMEQTPSVSNWLSDNSLKRPGVMRLQSYQAIAHGADTMMFFQMRQSPGGCEKFHGGIIDHSGRDDTRMFRECSLLGAELKKLGSSILGCKMKAEVALLFDWETWWAVEGCIGPTTRLNYVNEILNYYRAFHQLNIQVDIIGPNDDFSQYKAIAAPMCYIVKTDFDQRIQKFVEQGGTTIFTYFSGYSDENDYITVGGFPGKLKELTGIWAEETDVLAEGTSNSFIYKGRTYPAQLLCDIMHAETAKVIAEYQQDFYSNTPAITCNYCKKGKAYYVGTQSSGDFYKHFIHSICTEENLVTTLGVPINADDYSHYQSEIVRRESDEATFVFLLNHENEEEKISIPFNTVDLLTEKKYCKNDVLTLNAKQVAILAVKKEPD